MEALVACRSRRNGDTDALHLLLSERYDNTGARKGLDVRSPSEEYKEGRNFFNLQPA